MNSLYHLLASIGPLLAQEEQRDPAYPISWLLVALCLTLGLMMALRPDKREDELKRERKF